MAREASAFQQLRVLLWKRYLSDKRNAKTLAFTLFSPIFSCIFVGVLTLLLKNAAISTSSTSLSPNPNAVIAYSAPASAGSAALISSFASSIPSQQLIKKSTTSNLDIFLYNGTATNSIDGSFVLNTVNNVSNTFDITLKYNGTNTGSGGDFASPRLLQSLINSAQKLLHRSSSASMPPLINGVFETLPGLDTSTYMFQLFGPLLITYGYIYLIPAFANAAVFEKQMHLKQQILLTGVSSKVYWLHHLMSDFFTYFLAAMGGIIVLYCFGVTAFTQNSFLAWFPLFSFFGFNVVGVALVSSFLFQKAETATRAISFVVTLLVIIPYIVLQVALQGKAPFLVQMILCILPNQALYTGLSALGTASSNDRPISSSFFSLSSLNGNDEASTLSLVLCIQLIQAGAMFFILLAVESLSQISNRPSRSSMSHSDSEQVELLDSPLSASSASSAPVQRMQPDEDVLAEENRILSQNHENNDVLRVMAMSKTFKLPDGKEKHAVKRISFGVPKGQIFGLLGPNGAGKSTLIGCLTGVVPTTKGDAFLGRDSLIYDQSKSFRRVGLCAQDDRLWPHMTTWEHLLLFARLRGLSNDACKAEASRCLVDFNLSEHKDKLSKDLSGGNKRKLCVACAFVGNEQGVVIIDEGSSGLDPGARRLLWNALLTQKQNGACIIVTTHYMEEADALSDRIGIVVNGSLRCLGSSQRLKSLYGGGYRLTITCSAPEEGQQVSEFVRATFPGARILSELNGFYQQYELPPTRENGTMALSQMFRVLEANRIPLGIQDYALSQTTLEQVFLYLAKSQEVDPLSPQ